MGPIARDQYLQSRDERLSSSAVHTVRGKLQAPDSFCGPVEFANSWDREPLFEHGPDVWTEAVSVHHHDIMLFVQGAWWVCKQIWEKGEILVSSRPSGEPLGESVVDVHLAVSPT